MKRKLIKITTTLLLAGLVAGAGASATKPYRPGTTYRPGITVSNDAPGYTNPTIK